MRCRQACAERMMAQLAAVHRATGPADALITGKNAGTMTEAEACRLAARQERQRRSPWHPPMSADQLQRWSRQRRRARQTHPGKR